MQQIGGTTTGEREWLGVIEIFDKKSEGIFRANITTAIFAAFILLSYIGMRWVGGPVWSPNVFLFFAGVAATVWIFSFVFGYFGLAIPGGSYSPIPASRVTRNTDLGPRLNLSPIAPFTWVGRPKALRTVWTDTAFGRLTASTDGIGGIISIPWSDVKSLSQVNSQTIRIVKQSKLFWVPIGSGNIVLHFNTEVDSLDFLAIAQAAGSHAPANPNDAATVEKKF